MKRLAISAATAALSATAFAWSWGSFNDSRYDSRGQQPPPPPPPQYSGGYQSGWQGGPPPPPPSGYWAPQQSEYPAPPRDDHGHKHHKHHSSGQYRQIGEFSSNGVREVSIGGGKTSAYIEFTSGITSINTIVVRRGGNKQSIPVTQRFYEGQRYQVPIDGTVTGLRISSSGNGRYRVFAK